tara:strand:+ start:655 stop:1014 length:360 start_codon:yes stop_codon:yes gene_type:complete
MKKLIQKWLGIEYINNSTVHKDIFWTEIDIYKLKIESVKKALNKHKDNYVLNDLPELLAFDNKLEDRLNKLEEKIGYLFNNDKALNELIDEIKEDMRGKANFNDINNVIELIPTTKNDK